jgi:hypothetical protein
MCACARRCVPAGNHTVSRLRIWNRPAVRVSRKPWLRAVPLKLVRRDRACRQTALRWQARPHDCEPHRRAGIGLLFDMREQYPTPVQELHQREAEIITPLRESNVDSAASVTA